MNLNKNDNHVFKFQIAAIKSSFPIYNLAWQINHAYKMDFNLSLNWTKESKNMPLSHHNHCFCEFQDVELNWHLIANRGSNSFFLSTKPMFDYFFICVGDDIYQYFPKAIDSIKKNQKIEHVFIIEDKLIKNKDFIYNNLLNTKDFIKDTNV